MCSHIKELNVKFFEKISHKIGFTQSEFKIILFIISAFIVGAVVNLIKDGERKNTILEYDYNKEDSIFLNTDKKAESKDSTEKLLEKGVASKRELLDFRNAKNEENKGNNRSTVLELININNATAEQLANLPGIGEKTAQNIIKYRTEQGNFKRINDLMNVKGIGKAKFDKLKNIITAN